MGTDSAKQIYKQRAATAETVNADAKAHRGMAATALRGLDKSPAAPISSPSPTTSCASSS